MATAAPRRPYIFVLAGVNGAGKSSVGGAMLADQGLAWYNPDTFAREMVSALGIDIAEANVRAWQQGRARLEKAIASRTNFAFETTLGARTIPDLLATATLSHDIFMIFCGLSSPEQHIERVRARVLRGGHDIPEHKIRERWTASRANLLRLMPHLARLQVFDNSAEAAPHEEIEDPVLVLEILKGRVLYPLPDDRAALEATPRWARAVVEAALDSARRRG